MTYNVEPESSRKYIMRSYPVAKMYEHSIGLIQLGVLPSYCEIDNKLN